MAVWFDFTSVGGCLIDCMLALDFLGLFLDFVDRPPPYKLLVLLGKSLPIIISVASEHLFGPCGVLVEFLLIPRPNVVALKLARTPDLTLSRSIA